MLLFWIQPLVAEEIWTQVNNDGFGDLNNYSAYQMATYNDHVYVGIWGNNGAQVWEYSGSGTGWTDVTPEWNSDNAGVNSMVVFNGKLYVGTYTGEIGAGVWAFDGSSWSQANTDGFGSSFYYSVDSMAVYNDYLYAGVSYSAGVVIWRYDGGTSWTQVNTDGFGDYNNYRSHAMAAYDGRLYAGTENYNGTQAWAYNGEIWSRVNADGFGDSGNSLTRSMGVYNDRLYLGTANAGTGADLFRYVSGATWEQVNSGDDFDTSPTLAVKSMVVLGDMLYVGTWHPAHGCQVWRTAGEGGPPFTDWTQVNVDGFEDSANYYANSMAVLDTLYVGTYNISTGAEVWKYESGSGPTGPPARPTNTNPADEAVIAEDSAITLQASAFFDADGHAHTASEWRVLRLDTDFLSYGATTAGVTFHEIMPELMYDVMAGLKYIWQVRYQDAGGQWSPWSAATDFKIGTSVAESLPEVMPGETLVNYGMVSIVHWPDDPSPEKVFNIKYDPRYYRIGIYDPVSGSYIEFGDGLEIEPGRSYWMLAREGLTVNFNGIPVSKIHDIEVCLHYGVDGWNMIAPPNDAIYAWGEVLVGRWVEGSPDLTIVPVALSSGSPDIDFMIDSRIWEWQAGAYVSYLPENYFLLERYKGYWVNAKVDGVYLVFPESAQTALSQATNAALSSSARGTTAEDGDNPPLPMGALEDSGNDNIFGGCFVGTVTK